jgi:hypothetical protein
MQKIAYQNGSQLLPNFFNEIQTPQKFNSPLARVNFFNSAESMNSWQINQRDSIKDWELPNPTIENHTSIGRSAHDGRVLGWTGEMEIVYGPARLTTLDFDGSTVLPTYHAIVEAGSVLTKTLTLKSWSRQLVSIGANLTSYVYYDMLLEQLVSAPQLPSRSAEYVPLAKLVVGFSGEVVEYVDLRQNTYIDSLGTYSLRLGNSLYINQDTVISPWMRALVDTTAGSVILTVPDDTVSKDGDEIAITDVTFSFNNRPIIIRSSDSTSVHNTTEDWVVYNRGIYLELYYIAETKSWNFKQPPSQEDDIKPAGTFIRCGGESYLGIKTELQCPTGTVVPDADGTYYLDPNTSQCYVRYYPEFAVYADGAEGVYTEKAMRCGATKTEVKNWLTL